MASHRGYPKREIGAAGAWGVLRALVERGRTSAVAAGVAAVVLAVGFVSAVTYYGAGTFGRRAADTRASNEAATFARHSGTLATGDAFDGYILMLRFADDAVVRDRNTSREARVASMQQLLYLNVNKFASLTIADRAGTVLATTDASITSVAGSTTFAETRATLSPENSDVVLAEPGKPGYVEYTVALKDATGATWGVLVGRADPARIWKSTLDATVDGSRNVIINSDGLFAAGVPDALLGQPWRGSPVGGGVRANIAGVDSICGLAPIGKDTRIDRGLNVASCLPPSVIQAETSAAMSKQGLVTAAAAVLAVVLAGGGLALAWRGRPAPAITAADDDDVAREAQVETATTIEPVSVADEPQDAELKEREEEASSYATQVIVEEEPAAEETRVTAAAAAVDALTLIAAYERRNARLSERLREEVQARLLVASTQAEEAYRRAKEPAAAAEDADAGSDGDDDEASAADALHARAMEELERVREQELRAIGQELHPGLIRLGLPAALRALRKELAGTIEVGLEADPTADSVGRAAGRASIPSAQRLALYRSASEAVRALAEAGATSCSLSLRREGEWLALEAAGEVEGAVEAARLGASALTAEAYGGALSVRTDGRGGVAVTVSMPAQPVEANPQMDAEGHRWDAPGALEEDATGDEGEPDGGATLDALRALAAEDIAEDEDVADEDADAGDEAGDAAARTLVVAAAGSELDLRAALERLREESGDAPSVSLEVELPEEAEAIGLPERKTAYELARVTVDALRLAGAGRCAVSVRHDGGLLSVRVESETGGAAFDATPIGPVSAAVEALGGGVRVERRGAGVRVVGEIAAAAVRGPAEAA